MRNSGLIRNPFDLKGKFGKDDYLSFGQKAKLALEQGADLGLTITPEFDNDDMGDNVDVLSSFHHDAFDIANEFGKSPDTDVSRPVFAPIAPEDVVNE